MRLFSQRWRADMNAAKCCIYCLLDVTLSLFIGILCWILFSGIVPPYKRGFYCDDLSIRLKYKPNTISVPVLLVVSIVLPMLLVAWYEISFSFSSPTSRHGNGGAQKPLTASQKWRQAFAVGTSINVEYLFGLMIVVAFMHFGKSAFGRLRPHFLDICRPNATLVTCLQGSEYQSPLYQDRHVYIEEPHCTSNLTSQIKVARESFPSGHTAVAVYAFLFVFCYIQNRMRQTDEEGRAQVKPAFFCSFFVRNLFVLIWLTWTLLVCSTRITDHWHHWTDVLGGALLGVAVGGALFFRVDSAFINSHIQAKTMDY